MSAKYYVYWNLHKLLWSVRYKGKVIDHCDTLECFDCTFKVNENGRQRVLKEKQKNVHAFMVCTHYKPIPSFNKDQLIVISYNPYKADHFFTLPNFNKIESCQSAYMKYSKIYTKY